LKQVVQATIRDQKSAPSGKGRCGVRDPADLLRNGQAVCGPRGQRPTEQSEEGRRSPLRALPENMPNRSGGIAVLFAGVHEAETADERCKKIAVDRVEMTTCARYDRVP